jgi:hypothetical protein
MIYNFNEFLLEKFNNKKVAIFLIGPPASGKSTFIKNFIFKSMRNFKIFNSDDAMIDLVKIGKEPEVRTAEQRKEKYLKIKSAIEKLLVKYDIELNLSDEQIYSMMDNNIYIPEVTSFLDNRLKTFIQNSSSNFVYETTGSNTKKTKDFINLSKNNGYEPMIISISTNIKDAIIGNLNRERTAQLDYQLNVIEKDYGDFYKNLIPNNYYEYNAISKNLTKLKDGVMIPIRPSFLRNKISN